MDKPNAVSHRFLLFVPVTVKSLSITGTSDLTYAIPSGSFTGYSDKEGWARNEPGLPLDANLLRGVFRSL